MTGTAWYASAAGQVRGRHHGCARLLPEGHHNTGCYFDIGAGYQTGKPARQLDASTAQAVGLPYAPGMAALLTDADNPARPCQPVVCFDLVRIWRRVQMLGYVIDRPAAVQVDLLGVCMAGLRNITERGIVQEFAVSVALLALPADHAHRVSHTAGRPATGKVRR